MQESENSRMNEKDEQLPEFGVSDRCARFLKWSIPCEFLLAVAALFHPFIHDRYETLCIGLAIVILQGMAGVGTIMFNQPRKMLVRGTLCFPLALGVILAGVLALKQDVAQRMRDEIMFSTNDLARRMDSLQRFSVRNTVLSEEEERDFAVRVCSSLHSHGYTNSVIICVSTNGDYFCSATSDDQDPIMGWISKQYVPIAISECANGNDEYALRLLQCPPLPESEFENWRDDCREIRFWNQSKMGMIGAVVLGYLRWLGVDASFVVEAKSQALIFTQSNGGPRFVLGGDDIDALIGESPAYILYDILPRALVRQGLVEKLGLDLFVDMYGGASYLCSIKDNTFRELPRSSIQGVLRQSILQFLESERQCVSDQMRNLWVNSLTNCPSLNSEK